MLMTLTNVLEVRQLISLYICIFRYWVYPQQHFCLMYTFYLITAYMKKHVLVCREDNEDTSLNTPSPSKVYMKDFEYIELKKRFFEAAASMMAQPVLANKVSDIDAIEELEETIV